MSEIKVTATNFEQEVLKSDLPVLVDFWATWCGPCQMLGPIIAEIAGEYDGKLKVGKINVDEEPALANQFGVSAIPTVFLFRDGKPVAKTMGMRPKDTILLDLGLK